jgi:hypothetical protein
MKNAILISGPPASGKTILTTTITKYKTTTRGRTSHNTEELRQPGVKAIVIEGVTKPHRIMKFLPAIVNQPIRVDREGEAPYEVSPFFIFISQPFDQLPERLAKHMAHFHLDGWQEGRFISGGQELPLYVVNGICSEMERRRDATALIDKLGTV